MPTDMYVICTPAAFMRLKMLDIAQQNRTEWIRWKLWASKIFFYTKLTHLFSEDTLNWSMINHKDVCFVTKKSISNKCCF